ncbi:unnamed protein product, partial [Mesorhabditis belari]|uniref:MSP domain-containing protein n=1 Tax=Mesorhabditis belari TaxID=2138241 RepID=A0AAF3J2U3_9BILA
MSTFTVDPPAAQLDAAGGKSIHTLNNGGAAKVVFKVKSSNNTEYRLNPVFGFVEPGAVAPLEVTRLAGPPKEDKLVIEFGDAPADAETPQDAFKGVADPQKLTISLTAQ